MFAALDLGTNNCRLLIARPEGTGYKVVETFSRSVRLGEGVWEAGIISDAAQARTFDALSECAKRLKHYDITKRRFVATETCRIAKNAGEFLGRVKKELGLNLKIISRQEEARLAVMACLPLLDKGYDRALIFDIGGGSTEMVWLNLRSGIHKKGGFWLPEIISWCSLSKGVVSLSEEFAKSNNPQEYYDYVVGQTADEIKEFYSQVREQDKRDWKSFHLLGTSGTVTTLAALSLGLKKYNRFAVDGMWMYDDMMLDLIGRVTSGNQTLDTAQSYVGMERADLLIPGCAILQAVVEFFPQIRMRIADRGVREGIMQELIIDSFNPKNSVHKTVKA